MCFGFHYDTCTTVISPVGPHEALGWWRKNQVWCELFPG